MRPHASERIPFVSTDGASVRLHSRMRLHVSLRGARRGAHDVTARALPPGQSPGRNALVPRFCNPPAFAAPPDLQLVPFQAVVRLMRVQVVQRREFDATSEANELLVLPCRTCGSHASWADRGASRSFRSFIFLGPGGAVVLLVD